MDAKDLSKAQARRLTQSTYTVEVGTTTSREIVEISGRADALRVARRMFDALGAQAHRAVVSGPDGYYVVATQRHGSGMLWRATGE